MSDEIFGNRCVSYNEVPWHAKGFVPTSPISAVDAFEKMGPYEVNAIPLNMADSGEFANRYAIVREPTPDSDKRVVFGVVTDDYALVPPADLAKIWDASLLNHNLPVPVETMGALYDGRIFFVSTELPTFDIGGDEYQNYMLMTSEMDGVSSIGIRVVPVRVVCNNTLIAAKKAATENYRLIHGPDMRDMLGEWLGELYEIALQRSQLLKETLQIFSNVKIKDDQAREYMQAVYPNPKEPIWRGPRELIRRAEARYSRDLDRMSKYRGRVMNLYLGGGTGLDHPAIKNTMCAALNAVVEFEDRREPSQGDDEFALVGAVWGERARIKEHAWGEAVKFSHKFSSN